MRVNDHCAKCLWDKQQNKSDDPGYLAAVGTADVILAKGQGNYESLCGQGRSIRHNDSGM